MRKSKEEKRIDSVVDAAYKRHGYGVPVDIFDIGKILNAGREAARNGQDVDEAVKKAVEQYRK